MSDTKEYIKGDKHVHQEGSVMIKFAQYNFPGQQGDWKRKEASEADVLEKEFADFENVVDETESQKADASNGSKTFVPDAEAIDKCFKFKNDLVKKNVSKLVAECYHGNYANLALIEITLFHHQQLKRRCSHKAFVMALAAWGIITIADDKEFEKIVMGVGDKYKRLPKEGYKDWPEKDKNDRQTCERMGKKIDPSMKYWE